jgi:predicted RNA-binding protein with RPS1 domain
MGPFEEAAKKRKVLGKSADGTAGGRGKKGEKPLPGHQGQGLGRSVDQVAKIFSVNADSVQQAKAILKDAEELAVQVVSCALSLPNADLALQQKRAAKRQLERDTAAAAKYAEAISNNQMTLQQAQEKFGEEEREAKDKLKGTFLEGNPCDRTYGCYNQPLTVYSSLGSGPSG